MLLAPKKKVWFSVSAAKFTMFASVSPSQKVGTGKKNHVVHKYNGDNTYIVHEWDRLKEDSNNSNAGSTERPSHEKI